LISFTFLILGVDPVQDLLSKVVNTYIVRPAPVSKGLGIVDTSRPAFSDGLSKIRLEPNGRAGYQLLNSCSEFLRIERNACEVVSLPLKFVGVGLQEFDCRIDAVVNIDHGQRCGFFQRDVVVTFLEDAKEYFCRIVCGPVERVFLTANDARVPDTSEIQVELVAKVFSYHFVKNF